MDKFGYVYKVTNLITHEFYIGCRRYDLDYHIHNPYLGSSLTLKESIRRYGIENFKKEILEDCESAEELRRKEAEWIKLNIDDPLCMNLVTGIGWGGVYQQGNCSSCGRFKPLYHDNLCMSCIKGDTPMEFCEECNKFTYRYEDGSCRSCASKKAHSIAWCDVCQAYTTHMGKVCKSHRLYLEKVDGKVQLKRRSPGREKKDDVVLIPDISIIDMCSISSTGRSVEIRLPENEYKIKSNNQFVGLKALIYNNDVTDWVRITYKCDKRYDHSRSIVVTSDHPLPIKGGQVVRADELKAGDLLIRVNQKARQYEYAEIIRIEMLDKVGRSYDVTTETEYFDLNQDILSHNCRSFLTPYVETIVIEPDEEFNVIAQVTAHENSRFSSTKPVDLWNQLIAQGNEVIDNRIYPKQPVYVQHKVRNNSLAKCKVEYLEQTDSGVQIHLSASIYYSRFNQGVVTINLPAVGLAARGDFDKFWRVLDDKLELCHRALRIRHERLLGTTSDVAPILWQYGAIARLAEGEKIDKLLYGGYSTISLGYAGLYECVKAMTGHSHTDPEAKEFALAVMQRLDDKCAEWRDAEDIAYSVYGTPLESTTYKFAKALQKRFGIIEGITDKNYITNSYHVHVTEKIDAFTKLKFESEFQKLSPGGAISYIEVPDMTNNIPAVLEVIKFIYNNIMYAELNTKSDYCCECGFDGEIQVIEEDGKLLWECPNCGNRDQTKMSVARRTCGYIGTQFWNQGRTQEIKDRVEHL